MSKISKKSELKTVEMIGSFAEKLLKNKSILPAFKISLLQLRQDAIGARYFWKSLGKKELGKNIKRFDNKDKLHIGSGKKYMNEFVNLDILPPTDVIWDCRYGLPFSKNRFKFIFSEHFLEHVDFPVSAKKILKEIYRVLKPNGEVLISVPDGEKVINAYYKKDKKFLNDLLTLGYGRRKPQIEVYGDIDLVNYLFRDQFENPKYTNHYWAYDADSLKNFLKAVGFRRVIDCPFDPRYCDPEKEFFTFYIKAIK